MVPVALHETGLDDPMPDVGGKGCRQNVDLDQFQMRSTLTTDAVECRGREARRSKKTDGWVSD